MLGELLLVVDKFATFGVVWTDVFAAPHFLEEVLGVLVTFPVVAAPEAFRAIGKSTAVRAGVAFHVFTGFRCQLPLDKKNRSTYRRSHSRLLTLPHTLHLCSPSALVRAKCCWLSKTSESFCLLGERSSE